MEAGSCVHNLMAFKWDVNGGKMAGAVLAHGVLLSRRKTPWVAVQQGRGSNVLYRRQDEIPLPSSTAVCCEWQPISHLVWGHWLAVSILPPADKFQACPHSSIPADAAEPIKRDDQYSSFLFRQKFRCSEACDMLLFVFSPPLSFGLFTATFPTITVDKFNVPKWVCRRRRGSEVQLWMFFSPRIPTNWQERKQHTNMCDYIQPKQHQDVWTDVYQGWLTSASHILLLASAEAQSWWGAITPFLQPRGFARWRPACSTRSGRSRHPHASCAEKLRWGKVSSVTWSKQWFMNPCTALGDRLQRGTHRQLWPLTLSWIALMIDKQRGDWFHQSLLVKLSHLKLKVCNKNEA